MGVGVGRGVGVGGKVTGVGVGWGVAVGAGVAVGWGVGFGGKTIGVAVGRGVGKGGRTMGVGVNGMATSEGVGWGVTVGAGVAVGKEASAVATLSSAMRRSSPSERAHAVRSNSRPMTNPAAKALVTTDADRLPVERELEPSRGSDAWSPNCSAFFRGRVKFSLRIEGAGGL